MSWMSPSADNTYLIWFSFIFAIAVSTGLFVMHVMDPNTSLLSAEVVMQLVNIPALMLSYALGKKSNENNGNGSNHSN